MTEIIDQELSLEPPKGDQGPTNPDGRQLLSRAMDYPMFQRALVFLSQTLNQTFPIHLSPNIKKGSNGVNFYVVGSTVQRGGNRPREAGQTTVPLAGNPVDADGAQLVKIYRQNFLYHVQFNAIADDPFQSEELIDNLENFIITVAGILQENGMKGIYHDGRISDQSIAQLHVSKSISSVRYNVELDKTFVLPILKIADIKATIGAISLKHLYEFGDSLTITGSTT